MSVLVIAEPGSTHEGKFAAIEALIDVAADAGCDVLKMQWVSSADRLCERRGAPTYLDAYRKIAFPEEWHQAIRTKVHARGMRYACSVFLPEDVAFVAAVTDFVKLASFEAADPQMMNAVTKYEDKLIVSTGMLEASEASVWVGHCYALLHCVSSYVTPLEQANLAAIGTMTQWVGEGSTLIGWSDHTREQIMGALAVAAGAKVIEFHVRDWTCPKDNADHDVSRSPAEAVQYVHLIRRAVLAYGDGVKAPQACEEAMRGYRVVA